MSLKVEKITIESLSIKKTKELDEIIKLIEKHGTKNAQNLLPKSDKKKLYFELHNSNSAFANAIRRTLIDELPTKCMAVDSKNIYSDDKFISRSDDVLINNISLIPIKQNIESKYFETHDIGLDIFNDTDDIIEIKVSDIIVRKKDKKESASTLFPDTNIILTYLRPGKQLRINNIRLEEGYAYKNACKFTLLNNVMYRPLDIEPYDQFTGKGTKSIEKDCKSFAISFTTTGSIEPMEVIKLACEQINFNITDILQKIQLYINASKPKFYSGDNCEVDFTNDIYTFKLTGHYLTELNLISAYTYLIDNNVPFVTSTVERYDTMIGLLKIKHTDIGVLISAIEECKKDLKILEESIKKKI